MNVMRSSRTGPAFESLRDKWREVPNDIGGGRVFSDELLRQSQTELFEYWQKCNAAYRAAEVRRWCQILYSDFVRDKAVLEIGSGLGFDGVFFLQQGARHRTFCDVVSANLDVIRQISKELGLLSADFVYIDDNFECFDKLGMFDVIWADGSLIHVPFEFARAECMKVLPHLEPGGRWIELCYPPERWIREGRLPFSEWGKVTDGERTPWVEWYDLVKIKRRLFPAPLGVILKFNFHEDTFNWFDLVLTSDKPFDSAVSSFDLNVFPASWKPEAHGDTTLREDGGVLEIVTPEAMWNYAASFDLAAAIAGSQDSVGPLEGGFTIELELQVSSGHVGVMIVGDDISTPVCREYIVAVSTEPTSLMIGIPPRVGARRLILRNIAAEVVNSIGRSRCWLEDEKAQVLIEVVAILCGHIGDCVTAWSRSHTTSTAH